MSTPEPPEPELVILPRPLIIVGLKNAGEVEISVTEISEDNQRVEMSQVIIPRENVAEVAKALAKLGKVK